MSTSDLTIVGSNVTDTRINDLLKHTVELKLTRLATGQVRTSIALDGTVRSTVDDANSLTDGFDMIALRQITNGIAMIVDNVTVAVDPVSAPAAPVNIVATPLTSQQVNLAWDAGDSSASGFVVEQSTEGGAYTSIATLNGEARNFRVRGLSANTDYRFQIKALNSVGESEYGLSGVVTTSALSEFLIADDAFTDGGRTNGADGGDLEWAKPSSTTLLVANDNVIAGGNALKLEGQSTSVEALTPALSQATALGTTIGSTIQLSMNVRASALASRDTGLRVGLYQQQGTLVTGDTSYANSKNDTGYFATFGTGGVAGVALYKESANAGDSLLGGTGITLMTPVGTTTPVQINDTNKSHLIVFTLTRIANGGVRVSASVDGIQRIAADDATPIAESYDLLAVKSAEAKFTVAVDNVSVINNPLAEVQAPPA